MFIIAGLAGLGVGHAVWDNSSSSSASPGAPVGGTTIPIYGNSGGSSGGSSGLGGSGSGSSGFGSGSSGFGSGSSNPNDSTGSGAPSDTQAIATKVDPGLVDVNTTLGYQDAEAAGTGIVLTSTGLILTNNHVISGATSISVTDVGNNKTYAATVVGYDRTSDVAIIQLTNAKGLQTAVLGSSSNLADGQAIVGIGNAGGAGGTPTYAGGSITALNQSITASDEGTGTSEQLTGLIETNADIQPGDSGGPLVNTSGQVIGMDTAASSGFSFSGGDGTEGFAIPIDTVLSIAQQIRNGKASTTVHLGATPFLGVGLEANGTSSTGTPVAGTTIEQVIPDTPAAKLGLTEGDSITALGGVSITTGNALTTAIDQYHPGNTVSITWTDTTGASHTANVTLAVGPAD